LIGADLPVHPGHKTKEVIHQGEMEKLTVLVDNPAAKEKRQPVLPMIRL